MFQTPILLITFNRPVHTRRVLTEILKQEPQALYVCQDGSREGNENDRIKCQEVRDVIDELISIYTKKNKHFKLHTLYQPVNLGCGPGPAAGITWFFEHVEQGIILEDDIVPHPLFFSYCAELLERYKNDERIGMIAGHNYFRKYSRFHSYYFTFDTEGTLGWATWRRVWKGYDFNVAYDAHNYNLALQQYMYMPRLYRHRMLAHFNEVLSGSRHDRWDYQWEYFLQMHGYLNIKPNSCLTSHEGNDSEATHHYDSSNYAMDVNELKFTILDHPRYVCLDWRERLRVYNRTLRLLKQMIKV